MTIGERERRMVVGTVAAVFAGLVATAAVVGGAMAHVGESDAVSGRIESALEARGTGRPQAADAECMQCEQVADVRPSGAMMNRRRYS